MNMHSEFLKSVSENIEKQGVDNHFRKVTNDWVTSSVQNKYTYNFSWMGRPVIQYPQDLLAMQELIFKVKPDLVVETGVAHGGSLIFSASMLELIGRPAEVLGIDIDIRSHNREAIEAHPMKKRIQLLQGSSISSEIITEVKKRAAGKKTLVILDSNHTYEHVKTELELYSPLVQKDSYMIVFDTVIDDLSDELSSDRPWGFRNGPKKAVHEFLASQSRFQIDVHLQNKLMITAAPDGYLSCVADL